MGVRRHHFAVLDSTNNCAKRNAHLFNPEELTLLTANEQTAGRGRGKHQWVSPAHDNIYATLCFFLPRETRDLGNASQLLAISATSVLRNLGFEPHLKWPNDILENDKKIGGILCEAKSVGDKICIISGIGINVNMRAEMLAKIDQPATSLMEERGHPFDVEKVLKELQTEFAKDLEIFKEKGFSPFVLQFKSLVRPDLNKTIRFNDNVKVWEGVFHSVNEDGSLNLLLPTQELKRFYAGQIVA